MSQTLKRAVTIISSPYHVGFRNQGVGAGPKFIRSQGLVRSLEKLGVCVNEVEIEPVDEFEGEIGRSFELMRRISTSVATAHDNGAFPIILSGNCSATVGVAAGCARFVGGGDSLGCVWFDAHDDYNTPDTVMSGYFDSQAIAMMAGECWKGLLGTIPGYTPFDVRTKLIHVGMRDVNELEKNRVLQAGFDVVWGNAETKVDFAGQLGSFLDKRKLGPTMVHLDYDSLDISLGKASHFAVAGGLLEEDLQGCFDRILAKTQPVSLTVASLDPSSEGAQNIAAIAARAITRLVKGVIVSGSGQ